MSWSLPPGKLRYTVARRRAPRGRRPPPSSWRCHTATRTCRRRRGSAPARAGARPEGMSRSARLKPWPRVDVHAPDSHHYQGGRMDDVELCPPYWPALIWKLIHHHGPVPQPDPSPWMERIFAGLAIHQLASTLEPSAAAAVRDVAVRQVGTALGNLGRPSDEPGSPVGPRTRVGAAAG